MNSVRKNVLCKMLIKQIFLRSPFLFFIIPLSLSLSVWRIELSISKQKWNRQFFTPSRLPSSVDFPNESLGKNWQTGWNAKPPAACLSSARGTSVVREYTVLNFHPQSSTMYYGGRKGKKEKGKDK